MAGRWRNRANPDNPDAFRFFCFGIEPCAVIAVVVCALVAMVIHSPTIAAEVVVDDVVAAASRSWHSSRGMTMLGEVMAAAADAVVA